MTKTPKPFFAAVLRPVLWALLAALPVLGIAADTAAQMGSGSIRGRAPQVIDSGLIDFAGQPIYLYGLRGVPPAQNCPLGRQNQQNQQTWACGQEARWATANRIANHWVDCVERARGAGGEIFAVCYLGGVGGPELNAWLVEQGWAKAARDYAQDYVAAEDSARAAGRGLWRGQ